MTRLQTLKHHDIGIEESGVMGRVLVKPRHMTKLVLGMYERNMPEPKFQLEFESSGSDVNASLHKFTEQDHYTLVYHFQNYGDRTCRVTVKEV